MILASATAALISYSTSWRFNILTVVDIDFLSEVWTLSPFADDLVNRTQMSASLFEGFDPGTQEPIFTCYSINRPSLLRFWAVDGLTGSRFNHRCVHFRVGK